MGWFSVLLPGIAAFLFFKMDHTVLMVISIIIAIGCFWSWGIMHNYATELAKRRVNCTGEFYDITDREAEAVPDWITYVNMILSFAGLVLLIIAIVFIIWK